MLPFFYKRWERFEYWIRNAALQAIQHSLLIKRSSTPVCRVLCVDDDSSFCRYIQRVAYSLGIEVISVHSVEEAKQSINENPDYQAYIIDGHLPDGSGFELIAWIREKRGEDKPIGFITRIYQDANSFRLLKSKLDVDVVLDKPVQTAEVHQMLVQLCCLDRHPPYSESLFPDFLKELKDAYVQEIPNKIKKLESLILAVEKTASLNTLQALRAEVHRIAGSAGSYGYMAVSELCMNLELELIEQIELVRKVQFNPQWLLTLDDFFTQVKLHFQMEMTDEQVFRKKRSRQLPALYMIDEDVKLLDRMRKETRELRFEILTESRPDRAIQTLLSADFFPQILLLKFIYEGYALTGSELLKAFLKRSEQLSSVVGILVERGGWPVVIAALRKGMICVIEKPFDFPLAFHLLDQIPFHPLPMHFKVLVVDDDPDICAYIIETLKYAGMEASAVQQIEDLKARMHEFKPDLILLDVNLTDDSGILLVKKLRKTAKYKKLMIGMVAISQKDTITIERCYDSGLDDIIFQPLDRSVLLAKVAGILKNLVQKKISASSESALELEKAESLKEYLAQLLRQWHPPFPKILVMFEIEHFSTLKRQDKRKVLAQIYESFSELLRKHEIAAEIGEGRYALIFQGYDPHFVQLFMREYLTSLRISLLKFSNQVEVSINEALVFLESKLAADQQLKKGEDLICFARHLPDLDLRMIMEPSFIPIKEVFVFHDEGQSLEFIETIFIKNEFRVSFKTETEQELFQSMIPLPLLILTGSFAKLEGLSFIKRWSMQNQVQVPVILLSQLFDARELDNFLNEINYYACPFSLVIIAPSDASLNSSSLNEVVDEESK